jgi:hypothetical protein
MWTGYISLRVGTMVGPCGHCNELPVSIKGGEFLD